MRARSTPRSPGRRSSPNRARSCSAAARERCALTWSSTRAAGRWPPTPSSAATSYRSCDASAVTFCLCAPRGARPSRSLRRRRSRTGAFTERAFREAADAAGLAGRERAQAQRLAYGAVQRRGTPTRRSGAWPTAPQDCSTRRSLAALRLGLYELLFGDATPDHAAVDQAVESVKAAGAAARERARQRSPAACGPRARRRCRGAARRRLDPRGRRGRPLGPALAGADVVGGARLRRRPVAARCLQRPRRGGASNNHSRASLAAQRDRYGCSLARRSI